MLALLMLFVAADANMIAGRDLDGWSKDLQAEDRIVRARAAKTLGAFGEEAADVLSEALENDEPAVRYWSAYHLGRLKIDDEETVEKLQQRRDKEEHAGVQLALAYALCRLGKTDENLDLLVQRLEHPSRGMACSAAELLGMLGSDAKQAVPALEAAYAANKPGGKGDYHLGGASQNALRKIRGED